MSPGRLRYDVGENASLPFKYDRNCEAGDGISNAPASQSELLWPNAIVGWSITTGVPLFMPVDGGVGTFDEELDMNDEASLLF